MCDKIVTNQASIAIHIGTVLNMQKHCQKRNYVYNFVYTLAT